MRGWQMRRWALLVVVLALVAGGVDTQEKRLALVVGNGAYNFNTVLKNPVNDAADMAAALKQAGFEVILLTDATMDSFNRGIREFGKRLADTRGVGLFYYSGHGASVKGKNYLLPVDTDIQAADEIAYKAVDAEAVLAKMESAGNSLNLVFLDSCRNNPFPGSSKSAERGLSVIKVDLPESVVVYAAEPGKTASDGEGRNSPFTRAFLKNLASPGDDILVVMKRVKAEVAAATQGQQSPRVDQNLSRDFAFFPARAASGATPAASAGAGATGRVLVSSQRPALVYLNEEFRGMSSAGEVMVLSGVPAGPVTLRLDYGSEGGQSDTETRTLTLAPGGLINEFFQAAAPVSKTAAGAAKARVITHKASLTGGEVPDWASLEVTGIEKLPRFKGMHVLVIVGRGSSLIEASVDQSISSTWQEMARYATSQLNSLQPGPGMSLSGAYLENIVKAVANMAIPLSRNGAGRRMVYDSFWILVDYPGLTPRREYQFMEVLGIPMGVFKEMLLKAIEENPGADAQKRAARAAIEKSFPAGQ